MSYMPYMIFPSYLRPAITVSCDITRLMGEGGGEGDYARGGGGGLVYPFSSSRARDLCAPFPSCAPPPFPFRVTPTRLSLACLTPIAFPSSYRHPPLRLPPPRRILGAFMFSRLRRRDLGLAHTRDLSRVVGHTHTLLFFDRYTTLTL